MGFGHTQTWVPANDKDEYFRCQTKFRQLDYSNCTSKVPKTFTRKIYFKYTTSTFVTLESRNRRSYDGHDHLHRVEASVSPNGKYFMIASIWDDGSGHFGLFDLNEVNQKVEWKWH